MKSGVRNQLDVCAKQSGQDSMTWSTVSVYTIKSLIVNIKNHPDTTFAKGVQYSVTAPSSPGDV